MRETPVMYIGYVQTPSNSHVNDILATSILCLQRFSDMMWGDMGEHLREKIGSLSMVRLSRAGL
jgi:hypothetical protein